MGWQGRNGASSRPGGRHDRHSVTGGLAGTSRRRRAHAAVEYVSPLEYEDLPGKSELTLFDPLPPAEHL